jgi:hypothetical protein
LFLPFDLSAAFNSVDFILTLSFLLFVVILLGLCLLLYSAVLIQLCPWY